MSTYLIACLMVLGCCLSIGGAHAESLIPHRVQLMDWRKGPTSNHYLVRSNEPVVNVSGTLRFAYDELVATIGERAGNQSIPWTVTPKPYIYDISLLNDLKKEEREDMRAETEFFKANASLGSFHNWVMIGNLVNPQWLPPTDIASAMNEYIAGDLDQLVARMAMLRALLLAADTDPRTQNFVILFHCEGGTDRTGELAAAYAMQFQGKTLRQALDWDVWVGQRAVATASVNGIQWYCWYLTYVQGYTNLQCADVPTPPTTAAPRSL